MSFDPDYYLARLNAERAAAVHAASEEARAVHEALADEYAELLAAHGHSRAGQGWQGPE